MNEENAEAPQEPQAEEAAIETAPVETEAVLDSPASVEAPGEPLPNEDICVLKYLGPLEQADMFGVTFPKGVSVKVDRNIAAYVLAMHALDECFVKE